MMAFMVEYRVACLCFRASMNPFADSSFCLINVTVALLDADNGLPGDEY
jgi:hypothetical protein